MRFIFIIVVALFVGCAENKTTEQITGIDSGNAVEAKAPQKDTSITNPDVKPQTYENARFRNVVVKKLAANTYQITGEGQIFEASFNWVVDDGHNELKSGYTTTEAGAPDWGKFDFTVTINKARENSQLHLIIYEASAQDGSRQHELPLPLP